MKASIKLIYFRACLSLSLSLSLSPSFFILFQFSISSKNNPTLPYMFYD